jgi:hypothetical protein
MSAVLSIAALLLAAPPPVPAAPGAPLSASELATVCALTQEVKLARLMTQSWNWRPPWDKVAAQRDALAWRPLPAAIDCAEGERNLRPSPHFIDAFAISADGRFAGLSGGFLQPPGFGNGYRCYFRRFGRSWSLFGCQGTWIA